MLKMIIYLKGCLPKIKRSENFSPDPKKPIKTYEIIT